MKVNYKEETTDNVLGYSILSSVPLWKIMLLYRFQCSLMVNLSGYYIITTVMELNTSSFI